MNALKRWLRATSIEQHRALARLAKTTPDSLHQTAGAYRTKGKLTLTPDFARRLEEACLRQPDAPPLRREDLCPACGRCELAKAGRR